MKYAIGEGDSIVGTPRINLQLTEGVMQPAQSQVKVEIRLEDSRDAMNYKHQPVRYYPVISATKRLRIEWAAINDDADVDNYD